MELKPELGARVAQQGHVPWVSRSGAGDGTQCASQAQEVPPVADDKKLATVQASKQRDGLRRSNGHTSRPLRPNMSEIVAVGTSSSMSRGMRLFLNSTSPPTCTPAEKQALHCAPLLSRSVSLAASI